VQRVNTRIVAATNRPLSDLVTRGLFRTDLYYRLSGVEIQVPALRHRQEDIPALVKHFLERHQSTRQLALSDSAGDALRLYAWPGNVRELERLIERAVALAESSRIEVHDLPPRVRGEYHEVLGPALAQEDSLRSWGSRYARLIFDRCGRNKRRTCRILDISYHTLEAYLRYGQPPASIPRQLPAWVHPVAEAEHAPATPVEGA
jgi:DNA-binding NtrC family response regulator